MAPSKAGGGCLEMTIPTKVLEHCQIMDVGQSVDLIGNNKLKGGRKSSSNEAVQVTAKRQKHAILFSLNASSMGAVFQKKLSQTWQCELSGMKADFSIGAEDPSDDDNYEPEEMDEPEEEPAKPARTTTLPSLAPSEVKQELDDMISQSLLLEVTAGTSDDIPQPKPLAQDVAFPATDPGEGDHELPSSSFMDSSEGDLKFPLGGFGDGQSVSTAVRDATIGQVSGFDSMVEPQGVEENEAGMDDEEDDDDAEDIDDADDADDGDEDGEDAEDNYDPTEEPKAKKPKINNPRLKTTTKLEDLVCEFCQRSWFPSLRAYHRHYYSCHASPHNPKTETQEDIVIRKRFTCDICLTVCPRNRLKKHREAVHNTPYPQCSPDRHSCIFCKMSFANRVSLYRHKKYKCELNPEVTGQRVFCKYCSSDFDGREKLEAHIEKVHPNGFSEMCHICGKEFSSRTAMYKHSKLHIGDDQRRLQCPKCRKNFIRKSSYDSHMAKHAAPKKHQPRSTERLSCVFCKMSFANRVTLYRHKKYRCELNPDVKKGLRVSCKYCSNDYDGREKLEAHIEKVHPNGFSEMCHICGKKFASRTSMYAHSKLHMGDEAKKRQCPICGKKFIRKSSYDSHMAKHTDLYSEVCDICGKKFRTKSYVQRHIAIVHHNKYAYHCTLCGHGVMKKQSLESHICGRVMRNQNQDAIDSPKKSAQLEPYSRECEICGKISYSKSGYFNHKLTHDSERAKRFKCETCGRGFSTKIKCENHAATHSDSRSFVCEHCEKSFKTQKNLRQHVRSLHENNYRYRCQTCGHGVTQLKYLNAHVCGRVQRVQPDETPKA